MENISKIISLIGLLLTVVPSFFVFGGSIEWQTHATLMLIGTILWFASAPFWLLEKKPRLAFWKRHRPI